MDDLLKNAEQGVSLKNICTSSMAHADDLRSVTWHTDEPIKQTEIISQFVDSKIWN